MAYAPIAYIAGQYEDYENWWLKCYQQGTTTPLTMATDSSGGTTAAKFEVNSNGYLKTSGGAIVIPHVEQAYDAWIFPTEAEADANDTTNALQLADNVTALPPNITNNKLIQFDNKTDMVAATFLSVGDIVETAGYTTVNDGGGAKYEIVAAATGTDDGGSFIDLDTHQAKAIFNGTVNVKQFGVTGDGVTDDSTQWQIASDFAASNNLTLVVPKGTFILEQITPADNLRVEGLGGTLKLKAGSLSSTAIYQYSGATHLNNISFYKVRFDGNKANQSGTRGVQAAIDIGNVSDLTVESCRFVDCYYYGMRVDGTDGAAINTKGSCQNIRSINNFFEDVEGNAHQILSTDTVTVKGAVCDNIGTAGGSGAGFAGAAVFVNGSKNVVINGINVNVCSDSAIYCEDCEIGSITNFTIYDAAKSGVKWQGSSTENVVISSGSVKLVGAQGVLIWSTVAGAKGGLISDVIVETTGSASTTFAQVTTTSMSGIYCENVDGVHVNNVIVKDAGDGGTTGILYGIYFVTCTRPKLSNFTVSESAAVGVAFANCVRPKAVNGDVFNNGQSVSGTNPGVLISNGSTAVVKAELVNIDCYDDQGTKTQDYGLRTSGSQWGDLKLVDVDIRDGNHVTGGFLNSATNITVESVKSRTLDSYTFTASDTTPSVEFAETLYTDTGALTITRFDGGVPGQKISVISKGAITYDTTGTNLSGSSVDIVTAAGDITTWTCDSDGTTWILDGYVDVSVDNSAGA